MSVMIMKRQVPIRRSSSSKKGVFSLFRVISFLISLQLVAVFLVALNLGSDGTQYLMSPGIGFSSSWFLGGDESTPEGGEFDPELAERLQQEAALDEVDPRQDRVLYNPENDNKNNTTNGEDTEERIGLDNYGSRPHFPWKNVHPAVENTDGPYLVVGGSDGSGTRAVVNTLTKLGAFFRIEDQRTMDVHGAEMFHRQGWPPLVWLALKQTHSANYELSDMTEDSRDKALAELKRLKKSIDARSKARLKQLNNHGGNHTQQYATAIKVGWKAPVSMFVLPMIQKVFGRVKYLHVVRDGRDVCLSENQSPVRKFYNTYYGLPATAGDPSDENITTLSIQLWNDVNQQVMEWGKSHSDGETFDYLMIRSEDLVNPDTKFEALLQLADFIGSRKSLRQICCMSQQQLQDMGKSQNGYVDPKKQKQQRRHRFGFGAFPHEEDIMPHDGPREDFVGQLLFQYGRGMRSSGGFNKHSIRDKVLHHRRRPGADAQELNTPDMLDLVEEGQRMSQEEGVVQHAHSVRQRKDQLKRLRQMRNTKRKLQEQDDNKQQGIPRRQLQPRHSRLKEMFLQGRLGGGGPRKRFVKEAPEQVKARYGKWVKALESRPELSQQLHELGKSALKTFGYEPPAQFLDPPNEVYLQQCQAMMEADLCDEPEVESMQ